MFLLLLVGHSALLHPESHPRHHSHAFLSSVGAEFAINVDHPHLFNGTLTACHDVAASAVLPRIATTLVELGVAAAVVTTLSALSRRVASSGRGPPHVVPRAVAGRDLLTLFCLTRR